MAQGRNHLYNNLKKQRKIHGYTIKEVARILNIRCADRISRWERGISTPNLLNAIKLGILYNTLVDQLYEEHRTNFRMHLTDRKKLLGLINK